MKDTDKLQAWAEEEKAKGLVDIKFFPGSASPVSVEEAAKSVLSAVTSDSPTDITNDPL